MEEIKSKVEEVLDSYYHYMYEITSCEPIDGHTKLVIYIDEGDLCGDKPTYLSTGQSRQ